MKGTRRERIDGFSQIGHFAVSGLRTNTLLVTYFIKSFVRGMQEPNTLVVDAESSTKMVGLIL